MVDARIGKYEILSRISRGGMADVYRCCLRGIGGFEKIVVVKRIRAERAADPNFLRMFLDEARLAASLNHPNIVQVFEVGEADGAPYLAMEYVEGATLGTLLRQARHRPVALRELIGPVAKVLSDVCEGLAHAHTARAPTGEALGLVHRDVSPQNIIITRQGMAKLLDFGVAKANGRLTETRAGTLKGKLRYMAPEQLGGRVDHRADLFAVGVCLYEATTGASPYGAAEGDEAALYESIARGRILPPSALVADYPPALEQIVLSALAVEVDRRCPSARELRDRLETFVADGPWRASARGVAHWVAALCPPPELAGRVGPVDTNEVTPVFARPTPEGGATASVMATTAAAPTTAPGTSMPSMKMTSAGHPMMAAPAGPRRFWLRFSAGLALLAGGAAYLAVATPEPGRTTFAPAPAAGIEVRAVADNGITGLGVAPEVVAPRASSTFAAATPPGRPHKAHRGARAVRVVESPPVLPPGLPRPARPEQRTSAAASSLPTERLARSERFEVPAVSAQREESAAAGGGIFSARPLSPVPRPRLPRVYMPVGVEDVRRVLEAVEAEALKAGCTPTFVHGITADLARALRADDAGEIYPAGLYYFIIREAGLRREKRAAATALTAAHRSGGIRILSSLPIDDRPGLAIRE